MLPSSLGKRYIYIELGDEDEMYVRVEHLVYGGRYEMFECEKTLVFAVVTFPRRALFGGAFVGLIAASGRQYPLTYSSSFIGNAEVLSYCAAHVSMCTYLGSRWN